MEAIPMGDEIESTCQAPGFTADGIAESLRDAFFLTNRIGDVIYVGKSLAEMLGTVPDSLVGRNISSLIRQDRLDHFLALRERLLSGEALQVEWEMVREDGFPSYLRLFLAPWRRGEEIVGVAGIAWDMTDNVLGERELERKALLLQLQMDILERLSVAEGITEMLRVIVDSACGAMGMEAGCMASLYPSERGWLVRRIIQARWPLSTSRVALWNELPGRDVAGVMESMEIFALREGEGPQEWTELQNYGSIIVVPILSSPRGAFVLMMASVVEMELQPLEVEFLRGLVSIAGQALKRAELIASLRQSEESYANLADSVREAVALVQSEKVLYANWSMANLMGFDSPDEMVGSMLEDFITADSLEDLRRRLREDDYVPSKARMLLKRRGGQEFITDVEIVRLPYGNRRLFQVMIRGEEDTGSVVTQSQMEFMSRLSHDFRTPLVSVSGFADILERLVEPGEDTRIAECLSGLKRGVTRLNRIVDNMLTLAKAGPTRPAAMADSSQVVREVLEDFTEAARVGGVEVVIPQDLPLVPMSEGDLHEVLQNLLSNAFRAVRGVESPRIVVGYGSSKGYHFFSVEDNGVGIPEEHHESVFKPLFRLVSGDEGSGLGLSIVRQILKASGGDVWLKSAPGMGTTFFFSIPMNP
jgi:PAS domain S-box-containing protein